MASEYYDFNWGQENQKCQICKCVISKGEPSQMTFSQKYDRNLYYCRWCCFYKVKTFYQQIDKDNRIDNQKCDLPDEIRKFRDFLKENCFICGPQCQKFKVFLDQRIMINVGRQCYLKLKKDDHQQKFIDKIDSLVLLDCLMCQQKQTVNRVLATKQQIEAQICKKCSKNNLKANKDYLQIKTCFQCKLPQILAKNKSYFGLIQSWQKKLFYVRKFYDNFKELHSKQDQKYFCSYCICKKYIRFEQENQKIPINLHTYYKLKEHCQNHFLSYCLVCGSVASSKQLVRKIQIPYNKENILCWLCQKCWGSPNKSQQQQYSYRSKRIVEQIIQYLKKRDKENLLDHNPMKKGEFDEQAKIEAQFMRQQKRKAKQGKTQQNYWNYKQDDLSSMNACFHAETLKLFEKYNQVPSWGHPISSLQSEAKFDYLQQQSNYMPLEEEKIQQKNDKLLPIYKLKRRSSKQLNSQQSYEMNQEKEEMQNKRLANQQRRFKRECQNKNEQSLIMQTEDISNQDSNYTLRPKQKSQEIYQTKNRKKLQPSINQQPNIDKISRSHEFQKDSIGLRQTDLIPLMSFQFKQQNPHIRPKIINVEQQDELVLNLLNKEHKCFEFNQIHQEGFRQHSNLIIDSQLNQISNQKLLSCYICSAQQPVLNLENICDQCFFKYLLGHSKVVLEVRKMNLKLKKNQNNQSQYNGKTTYI